ncbi:MAG: pyridoxal 5'-phosphate synthase lyase subunit PdxS [Candidatus Thermoplasmatota archaeon]|nr:pyridoxal 5'-phosphate synthase lyase subunit PdxS [Candidatus Thermoplasmatota archaeon]
MKKPEPPTIKFGTARLKKGFAKMQKGGVVMDVTNKDQAIIAEESGAIAVMALERVPADIRAHGGVARMADPAIIQEIMDAVSIPVMAKARIGHFTEAQALESLGVDMVDESEVLTPADPFYHIDKRKFTIPFVCGCRNLGEAVRRIWEGAAMIRTKGEAGTGNIIEAVRHQRMVLGAINLLQTMDADEILRLAETYAQSYVTAITTITNREDIDDTTLVFEGYTYGTVKKGLCDVLDSIKSVHHRLPVVNFAAGGVATPADAAIMMQLGSDGVFVGSGIFKSDNPQERAKAIVEAVAHFNDPKIIAEVSKNLGEAMVGIEIDTIPKEQLLQERGW